jgi:site-specific DNA-methyltransferase (cytosine-N4-specific)
MTKQTSIRRFTYGDQFDQDKTPLRELLKLCADYEGDRYALQEAIRVRYFPGHGSADNSKKMAMNCVLSLNAYRLIEIDASGKQYVLTELSKTLKSLGPDDTLLFKQFATHILTELGGLTLVRLIENIRARGEQGTLEYIGEELNDLGFKIPPNSTYVSTMRSWLAKAGVFRENGYEINWDVVYDLLHMDAEAIDRLFGLTPEQKYFLLSMVSLNAVDFMPSNGTANHARSVYSVRVTTKNLVKDILEPLEGEGWIESRKTTTGRGAKPHDVRLTEKGQNDLLIPLITSLAQLTEFTSADLNRPFEDVVAELKDADKHKRGIALELFAIWLIRLLGLRFSKWRLRSFQATGNAEVDVMAASDKIVYNRWQIQCKNIRGNVDVDTVAKEVGLTFLTRADVVMLVTTGGFTTAAVDYANQVTDNSRYYIILLDGHDIARIIGDRARIVDILNVKARRVFAKKELGITEFGDEYESDEASETEIGEDIAQQADALFSQE